MRSRSDSLWPRLPAALALAGAVDRVELKVLLCARDPAAVLAALPVDRRNAQAGQVSFLDTPDLELRRRGLLVRARFSGHRGDVTVKRRRRVRAWSTTMPAPVPAVRVEMDALPATYLRTESLRSRPSRDTLAEAVVGARPPKALLSAPQRTFLQQTSAGADVDRLASLGSVATLRIPVRWPGSEDRPMLDAWRHPDGAVTLELSCKCEPERADRTALALSALLAERDVAPAEVQNTKADTLLRARRPQLIVP